MASRAPRSGDRPQGRGFALLSNAFLDELRARTSLSGLIGRTTRLQKAGAEWKAPCPFHDEKTPSFYVNDAKAFYHCFGCGAHGDAIRWLTDQRGMAFMDAVKELADAAGIELPTPDPATRERVERAATLQDATAAAAAWFAAQLGTAAGATARRYVEGRGLSAATIAEFGIGYAPGGRHALAAALPGVPTATLIDAGLLIAPDGGGDPYDRFRDRVTIPIADPRGRVIAFGARALGDAEPKYLNSPETSLFDKGATLYNLHRAAPAVRKAGRLIVVEGYLDVIALAQAGIRECVAPLGTALTERQMEAAWRHVDVPLVCLDGDAAGRKAALRAASRALPVLRPGKSLCFALLPQGADPDDLVRSAGAAGFERAVADPVPLVRLLYEHERGGGDMAQPEQRAGLRARLDALAETCADRIVAQEYRRTFNDLFFEDFGWKRTDRKAFASAMLHTAPVTAGDVGSRVVRSLLYGLGRHPAVLVDHVEAIAGLAISAPRLARLRDRLVEAAWRLSDVSGDIVAQIMAADGLADLQTFRLQQDLRFGFARTDVPAERQAEILAGLVRCLCEERELDEGLSGLDRAAVVAAGEDEYLAIEAERQYLRAQKGSLYAWAYELGAYAQDDGNADGEDGHGRGDDGDGERDD